MPTQIEAKTITANAVLVEFNNWITAKVVFNKSNEFDIYWSILFVYEGKLFHRNSFKKFGKGIIAFYKLK